MSTIRSCWLVLLLSVPVLLPAQSDTSGLQLNQLTADDVLSPLDEDLQVVSTNRTAQDLRNSSYSIHVVTAQEILDNGYHTLVDVLKDVPGIRVSQPGSAIDGETFMMRGFYGNYYAKILINSVPIAPSAAGGMPIGGNLPIKQAERIEVIFGPASAIYGSGAMAGAINIITKDPDKAVFSEADIATGTNSFSTMNLMVGGKTGQGKNILSYGFWGGSSSMSDLNFYRDREVNFFPQYYVEDIDLLDDRPEFTGDEDSVGIGVIPSSSEYFGTMIQFRDFSLSYHYGYREMHSAVGLNPLVSTYDHPGTYYGEEISRINLRYQKEFSRVNLTTNLGWLSYRVDPGSNYYSVINYHHPATNYFYAASDDIMFEQLAAVKVSPRNSLVGGAFFQFSGNLPFTSYLDVAIDPDEYRPFSTDSVDVPSNLFETPNGMIIEGESLIPVPLTYTLIGGFAQWAYQGSKLGLEAGMRFESNSEFGTAFSPRGALTYAVSNNNILRASVSLANRTPTAFYRFNSLAKVEDNDPIPPPPPNAPEEYVAFENTDLDNEQLWTAEIGVRNYFGKHVSWDVSAYYNQLRNHLFYSASSNAPFGGAGPPGLNAEGPDTLGYVIDPDATQTLLGVQSNLTLRDLANDLHLRIDLYLSYAAGSYEFPFESGVSDIWPETPRTMGQLRVQATPMDRLTLMVRANYSDFWLSRESFDEDHLDLDLDEDGYTFIVDGYLTVDAMARFNLSRIFQLYGKVNNLTNVDYGGISATGTGVDLIYNPQLGRFYEMGLSFRFN